jgi:hypothetical protein
MPRSPSRDLADRFTGNRAYFHRSDRLRRLRTALALAAVALFLGWAMVDALERPAAIAAHSHGPLASPHAAWENDCSVCHRQHGSESGFRSIFQARDRWHDLTCERCHAGPAHHATATPAGRDFHARCSNCHHDHAGRTASLTHLTDNHCVHCHANLAASHASGASRYQGTITNFVVDHPEFRPLQEHAGAPLTTRTLEFSHAQHLTPGQAYRPGGKEAMTLGKLGRPEFGGAEAVRRYRKPGQDEAALVTLDCNSCHRLDGGQGTVEFDRLKGVLERAGEPARSVVPARAAGAYYLPVNFEADCRACHPLNALAGASAERIIPGFPVSHRKQPAELREELIGGYTRGLLKAGHPVLALPAEPGGLFHPRELASRSLRDEALRLANSTFEKILSTEAGCAKCHDLVAQTNGPARIAPVPDRTVWFEHARFDHASHRATTCATCHPGTAAAVARTGSLPDKEPIQIAGIETCKKCHAPARTAPGDGLAGAGVKHGCTDCHRYHDGDHPLQGRGATSRDPVRPLTLDEFLKGKPD